MLNDAKSKKEKNPGRTDSHVGQWEKACEEL